MHEPKSHTAHHEHTVTSPGMRTGQSLYKYKVILSIETESRGHTLLMGSAHFQGIHSETFQQQRASHKYRSSEQKESIWMHLVGGATKTLSLTPATLWNSVSLSNSSTCVYRYMWIINEIVKRFWCLLNVQYKSGASWEGQKSKCLTEIFTFKAPCKTTMYKHTSTVFSIKTGDQLQEINSIKCVSKVPPQATRRASIHLGISSTRLRRLYWKKENYAKRYSLNW